MMNLIFELLREFYLGSKCNKSHYISLFKKNVTKNDDNNNSNKPNFTMVTLFYLLALYNQNVVY